MSKIAKFGFIVGAALIAITAQAATTAICNGAAGNGASFTVSSDTYISNAFTPKCSKSVLMSFDQDATNVGVCAGSLKGNRIYTGSSSGGAVKETGTTDVVPTTTNTTSAITGCDAAS